MMGGYTDISKEDIRGSNAFLKEFFDSTHGFVLPKGRALGKEF
jgi:hypothetical protein